MRPFWAIPANPYYLTKIRPVLGSVAGEINRMLAPLAVYVGALALFAIVGIQAWNEFSADEATEPSIKSAWSLATRSYPAFAVIKSISVDKTESYEIFRHPDGGRKDVVHWGPSNKMPATELELYRPGGEWTPSATMTSDIAARMDPQGGQEPETAGIIDTKFGLVKLLGPVESADRLSSCLGFIKRFDEPRLQMSGWSCQGETLPAKRAAIGCLLDRLVLLTSGNEPKLAELFARAELKRGSCPASGTAPLSADWLTGTDNPRLRGLL